MLEEQADATPWGGQDPPPGVPVIDHESAFESGPALILDGLEQRVEDAGDAPRRRTPTDRHPA
ncbi:hypothetical protein [Actinomadura roseirufa]|uniref:hypothetical protein n=1 Tax=Actinomadura roseirufa TaxID=2094049 RepID=UPI001A95531A|nr:hypothetical protein [Actinomadura roseirufa]